MGGAMGNLVDRLSRGYVTDWISIGKFPVFNVADSSISVGAAVLIIGMWILERKQQSTKMETEQPLEEVRQSSSAVEIQSE